MKEKISVDLKARYTTGLGKAGLNCAQYARVFNCRMIGTFNLITHLNIFDFKPCRLDLGGYHQFYLVKLNDQFYGWVIKWKDSRQSPNHLEIISKERFPDHIKRTSVKVEVFERWDDQKIRRWAEGIHFFQTFEWTPDNRKAANSSLVWDTIAHVEFKNTRVLDIGCNFGYHSFRASREGARVIGFDKNVNVLPVARLINDNIEMQDVGFTDRFPAGERFDHIFYFSVQHQFDAEYETLRRSINQLKAIADGSIFIELIVPPLRGELSETQIDRILGSKGLLKYRHKVRRERKIYEIKPGG